MFGFLRKLFCSPDEPDNIYTPEERLLYHYWDGEKHVRADPVLLYKRVLSRGADLSTAMKVAGSISKGSLQAHNDLIEHIRYIFELQPLTTQGGRMVGLTELECSDLLDHFLIFSERCKKKPKPQPMSLNSSEVPPTPPSSEPSQTTEPSSESGCVETESSIDEPEPSLSASA